MASASNIHQKRKHPSICSTSMVGHPSWISVSSYRPYGRCSSGDYDKNRCSLKQRDRSVGGLTISAERLSMLIVRSPVRISFCGGGTDLAAYYERFGGVVLSAAINKHFYTVLEKRGDGKIQIISADLRTVDTWQDIARMDIRGNPLEIPLAVLKEFGSG